jgi:hypothetical protein
MTKRPHAKTADLGGRYVKPVRNIKLMGRMWRLRYVPQLKDAWGSCDDPMNKGRAIKISREAKGRKELEILLHEMQHACNWLQASEEFITQSSHDMANVLWRLGYRKVTNGMYVDDAGPEETSTS